MNYAIETFNLTRHFGNFTAVNELNLSIPRGHFYGLLGLNGAGKTTTIRMLTTLLPPSSGSARLCGHDVVKEPLGVRSLVGMVSDETSESQPGSTAREYLSYSALIRGIPDVEEEVERTLNDVGLDLDFRNRLPERTLCREISVIAAGRLVFTGATAELGADLDEFENRLRLLTS